MKKLKWIATDKSGQPYLYDSKPVVYAGGSFYISENGSFGAKISTESAQMILGFVPSFHQGPVSIEVTTKAKPKILQPC